jgi:hypothetical protein
MSHKRTYSDSIEISKEFYLTNAEREILNHMRKNKQRKSWAGRKKPKIEEPIELDKDTNLDNPEAVKRETERQILKKEQKVLIKEMRKTFRRRKKSKYQQEREEELEVEDFLNKHEGKRIDDSDMEEDLGLIFTCEVCNKTFTNRSRHQKECTNKPRSEWFSYFDTKKPIVTPTNYIKDGTENTRADTFCMCGTFKLKLNYDEPARTDVCSRCHYTRAPPKKPKRWNLKKMRQDYVKELWELRNPFKIEKGEVDKGDYEDAIIINKEEENNYNGDKDNKYKLVSK